MSLEQKMYKGGADSRTAINILSGTAIGLLASGGNPIAGLAGAFGGYVVDRAAAKSYYK